MWADDGTGDDQSQQIGDLESVEDKRCAEHNRHDQKKLQNRIFDGRCEGYMACECKHKSWTVFTNIGKNMRNIAKKMYL